eukprot:6679361-Pyramimonas_sp.AAC.1
MEELIIELDSGQWDFALINETWRTTPEEIWTTTDFSRSGNDQPCDGVALIIHRQRSKHIQ